MIAGAAKIPVRILREWLPMEGMGKIRDLPAVRCIRAESGKEEFLFVSVDATSIREQDIHRLKQAIYRKTGIRPGKVWICATHTFNVPHFRAPEKDGPDSPEERLFCAVEEAAVQAAGEALASRVPVRLGFGTGICSINVNRDVQTEDGWWLGENPEGIRDPRLRFLTFCRRDGSVLAVLGVFAVQSSVLHEQNGRKGTGMISADLLGEAAGLAEKTWPGAVVMLLPGAAGDQAPALKNRRTAPEEDGTSKEDSPKEQKIRILETLGHELERCLVRAAGDISEYEEKPELAVRHAVLRVKGQVLPPDIRTLRPVLPGKWEYRPDRDREVKITKVRLGKATLFGVAPELPAAMGLKLDAGRPEEPVLLCTMVDGAEKYMAYRESYETCRYEAMNSMFARGSAELLETKLMSMLEENGEEMKMKAVIFDLDGVLVSTDRFHFLAWKTIAGELEVPFDETVNQRLLGVSRMESLEIILEGCRNRTFSEDEKVRLAEEKNRRYREYLKTMTPDDVTREVRDTLRTLRERGYRIGLGSSSRNARFILERTGLTDAFDAVADGTCISRSKPDPEVFLKAAEFLHADPGECLVVEDAEAGIRAGNAAGMKTAAIGSAAGCGLAAYTLKTLGDLLEILPGPDMKTEETYEYERDRVY